MVSRGPCLHGTWESSGGDNLIIVTYWRNRDKYTGGVSLLEGSDASVAAVLLPVRDTKLLYCPLSLVACEQGSDLNFS